MLYYSRLGLFSKIVVLSFISYFGLSAIKQIVKFLFIVIFKITKRRNDPADVEKYDPDKIYLHMFFRRITKQVPNLSPFAIKLETWFRLKGIQYEVSFMKHLQSAHFLLQCYSRKYFQWLYCCSLLLKFCLLVLSFILFFFPKSFECFFFSVQVVDCLCIFQCII